MTLTLLRCQGSVARLHRRRIDGEPKKMTGKKPLNLEKSLEELETLIDELEGGDLPLEQAMKKFEQGIKLTRNCQAALKDAEQRVEILLKSAGGDAALEEFDVDEPD